MLYAFSECLPTTSPYGFTSTLKYFSLPTGSAVSPHHVEVTISLFCHTSLLITFKLVINCTTFALRFDFFFYP